MQDAQNSARESELEAAVMEYMLQPLPGANRTEAYNRARAVRRIREEDGDGVSRFCARLRAELPAPARVVEVGSGTGGLSVAVARAGYDVIGIEPAACGIQAGEARARRYPEVRCRFVSGIAERMPVESGSIDACISDQVLEHIADLDGAADEMHRILRPGGLLLHIMPNYAYPYEPHYRVLWPRKASRETGRRYLRLIGRDTKLFDESIYPTTNERVLGLFERHGFVGVHNRYAHEVGQKFDGVGIRSPRAQRLVTVAQRLGLAALARRVLLGLELYPAIVLVAWKPPMPDGARVPDAM